MVHGDTIHTLVVRLFKGPDIPGNNIGTKVGTSLGVSVGHSLFSGHHHISLSVTLTDLGP